MALVQAHLVADLVAVLHQVERRRHSRVPALLKPGLAQREEALDQVLRALVDFPLVQHGAQALKDRVQAGGRDVLQVRADVF